MFFTGKIFNRCGLNISSIFSDYFLSPLVHTFAIDFAATDETVAKSKYLARLQLPQIRSMHLTLKLRLPGPYAGVSGSLAVTVALNP